MPTNYTNVFGNDTVPPAGKSFRFIALTGHIALFWPNNYEGENYLASLNNVAGSDAGWQISLPPADETSSGNDFIMRNVGIHPFQVNNADGTPVAVVDVGEAKYFYLTDNASDAGTWGVINLGGGGGSGTGGGDASSLQGPGLTIIGSRLASGLPVVSTSSDLIVTASDRAKLIVFAGGSNILSLPSAVSVGDNFFLAVRNSGSGTVVVTGDGAETIDGISSLTLNPGESVFIACNGTSWHTIGLGRSTQFQFTKLTLDITAGGTFNLTSAQAANKLLKFIGTPSSNVTVILPAITSVYYIQNAYTGTPTLTIKTATGAGATMTNNDRVILTCDGVDVTTSINLAGGVIIDGTVTNPAYPFASDADTGTYLAGANTLGMAAGGQTIALFSPLHNSVSGNWGVGVTAPTAKLDVRGRTHISGNTAVLPGSLPVGTMLQVGATDNQSSTILVDTAGSSGLMMFRSSLGTVASPTALVNGSMIGALAYRGRDNSGWSGDQASVRVYTTNDWTSTSRGTKIEFLTTQTGSTVLNTRGHIGDNGRWAIGVGVPNELLHVFGNIETTGYLRAENLRISRVDELCCTLETGTADVKIQFRTGGADTGFAGSDANRSFFVISGDLDLETFRVTQEGLCQAPQGFIQNSDERLKEDWEELHDSFVEDLAGLLSGKFTDKRTGERRFGVGAQSLQRFMPEAVKESIGGMLGVAYGDAALVACVKLAQRVVDLTKRVNNL